jgi:hypothetical protein
MRLSLTLRELSSDLLNHPIRNGALLANLATRWTQLVSQSNISITPAWKAPKTISEAREKIMNALNALDLCESRKVMVSANPVADSLARDKLNAPDEPLSYASRLERTIESLLQGNHRAALGLLNHIRVAWQRTTNGAEVLAPLLSAEVHMDGPETHRYGLEHDMTCHVHCGELGMVFLRSHSAQLKAHQRCRRSACNSTFVAASTPSEH